MNVDSLYCRREPYCGCSGKGGKSARRIRSGLSSGSGRPAAQHPQTARLGEPALVRTAQYSGRDRRQHPVELLGTVDDPVAVGEPLQQAVDERQRDVAQILDDGRVSSAPCGMSCTRISRCSLVNSSVACCRIAASAGSRVACMVSSYRALVRYRCGSLPAWMTTCDNREGVEPHRRRRSCPRSPAVRRGQARPNVPRRPAAAPSGCGNRTTSCRPAHPLCGPPSNGSALWPRHRPTIESPHRIDRGGARRD